MLDSKYDNISVEAAKDVHKYNRIHMMYSELNEEEGMEFWLYRMNK